MSWTEPEPPSSGEESEDEAEVPGIVENIHGSRRTSRRWSFEENDDVVLEEEPEEDEDEEVRCRRCGGTRFRAVVKSGSSGSESLGRGRGMGGMGRGRGERRRLVCVK